MYFLHQIPYTKRVILFVNSNFWIFADNDFYKCSIAFEFYRKILKILLHL